MTNNEQLHGPSGTVTAAVQLKRDSRFYFGGGDDDDDLPHPLKHWTSRYDHVLTGAAHRRQGLQGLPHWHGVRSMYGIVLRLAVF